MKRGNKSAKTQAGDPQNEHGMAASLTLALQHPTREQIEQRAYEIFAARGGDPGRELDDWLQAERELREQSPAAAAKSHGA